jgi:hypothetical protein
MIAVSLSRITKAAALAAAGLCLAASTAWPAAIIKGPYLQQMAQTSVVVMWETDVATTGGVDYGPTADYGWSATDPRTVTIHEVPVDGLASDSVYHYRVVSDDAISTDAAFRTAPPPGVPFRFAAYGDSRSYPSPHTRVINRIIADAPRLVIHVGDIVLDGSVYDQWLPQFFAPAGPLIRATPMALALGNHEHNAHWYYDFFSNPADSGTEAWYTFDYGDVRFICLDSDQSYAPGSAQYNWSRSVIAGPTDAIWTIVYFHHPPIASDDPVAALCEQYGADIVFVGHYHFYERLVRNNVIYVVTGGGGAELAPAVPLPYMVYGDSLYHHCIIDVNGPELTCHGVNANNGDTFDRFTLSRATTATSPTLAAGWHLVSIPTRPQVADPATVFAGVSIDQQLFRYDPETEGYVMYTAGDPGGAFGPLGRDIGCWLYLDEPRTFTYNAIRSELPGYIALPRRGWALIGHPRATATDISTLRVRDETTGTTVSLSIAQRMGWIELPMYGYDPATASYRTVGFDAWSASSSLEPWQGYWLSTLRDNLMLIVPAA